MDKILIVNPNGINQINIYSKQDFIFEDMAVRYNEIFILLSNLKKEQLLIRYSPTTQNSLTNTFYEFYERIYKINLKKKIKLIYSTSSHYSNGIFFEINIDEKERDILELKKDKIFILLNRNYKERKISITKIKELSEEERIALKNMGKVELKNWEQKRNFSDDSKKYLENLLKNNRNLSYENFFNGTMLSDNNIAKISNNKYKKNEDNLDNEEEKKRKELEKLKAQKEKAKLIEQEEIERLKRENNKRKKNNNLNDIMKKEEEERKKRQIDELERLKKQKEQIEKFKKEQMEELKREEDERLKRENDEKIRKEELMKKMKDDEEKFKRQTEEEKRLKKEKEEEEKLQNIKEKEE